MGNNPTRNPFRRAQLGLDDQQAVDEYKARSVWGAWWALDEAVRRRYFSREDRAFITRFGKRMDELATQRDVPKDDKEKHFVQVCLGEREPASPRERLWLLVQIVCRFENAVLRSARTDIAEHDAFALRAENTKLKARADHLEAYLSTLQLGHLHDTVNFEDLPIGNVEWMTACFKHDELVGPPVMRWIMSATHRGPPAQTLPVHFTTS